jgi:ABC-2 type transport system permease protein
MIRDLIVFLGTEVYASRRKAALVLIGFVVLPGMFMIGTAGFEKTLPEDIPVGIAPQEDATTEDDLTLTEGGVALVGTPVQYDSEDEATKALKREEVYLVVLVPAGITDESATTEFELLSHGSAVPLAEATSLLVYFMELELDSLLPGGVEITHDQLGNKVSLSEYLVPNFITIFVLAMGLIYFPYDIRDNKQVLDRVRHQSWLESFIGAKLIFYTIMMLLVVGTLALVNVIFDYRLNLASLETGFAVTLLFITAAAIGSGVLFLSNLSRKALFVNFGILIVIFGLGSILYPVGFFSSLRMDIARSIPIHYLAIVIRGHVLRGQSVEFYTEWYRFIGLFTVGAITFCIGSIRLYEWRA